MPPSRPVLGPERWPLCWAWGSPHCSAGGGSSQVMGTAWTAAKAAIDWCLIASAMRSANGFCSPATSPNSRRCHLGRSFQCWRIVACTSAQSAASTGCSTHTGKPIGGDEPGHHRTRALYRGCVHRGRIRCGVGTSPICRPASGASGFTSIW